MALTSYAPASTVPPLAELHAPADWRTVDCISDLHLQAEEPGTFAAWQRYMTSTSADAVFILGDLFEVWIGDDVIAAEPDGFSAACLQVLREASRQRPVFFMHGNRDFLFGQQAAAACGTTLLDDPTVLAFSRKRWLLSHGDALCLEDVDYLEFRALVRSPDWQNQFLAKPLQQRQQIARSIRTQSEGRKQSGVVYADVDAAAARKWLQTAQASTLVHGHTHHPAWHGLGDGMERWVLSDWDASATPPRADVLRISEKGIARIQIK
jgi:UDP-2,3-diacylglucosamine hydrolase